MMRNAIRGAATRLGRLGRTPVEGPVATGRVGNVMTRKGKVLDEAAQARSGYMRAGAVGGLFMASQMRGKSSGAVGHPPAHSTGGMV
jgi:hypothetical protein